jgi:hypothetical protein
MDVYLHFRYEAMKKCWTIDPLQRPSFETLSAEINRLIEYEEEEM